MIGAAPEFRAALAVAAKSARNRLPVLIVGEPGTGKETIARAIHSASLRAKGPLVTLDCKAVAANIIDSELFGHEKGAFPGAFTAKTGKIVHSDGGTLILDEIVLPSGTRLRNCSTACLRPVKCGRSVSTAAIPSTFASSRPAAARCRKTSIPALPSASARRPSICRRFANAAAIFPRSARHLLQRLADQTSLKPLSIGNDALAVLMRYGWPGNVRQLAGVLFRAALQCEESSLTAEHFPHIAIQSRYTARRTDFAPTISEARSEEVIADAPGVTLYRADGHLRSLEEIEADIIRLAIGHYRGRMTEVARRLGIGRSTLYRKLGELGIDTAA